MTTSSFHAVVHRWIGRGRLCAVVRVVAGRQVAAGLFPLFSLKSALTYTTPLLVRRRLLGGSAD
jgi:hypothetical protein